MIFDKVFYCPNLSGKFHVISSAKRRLRTGCRLKVGNGSGRAKRPPVRRMKPCFGMSKAQTAWRNPASNQALRAQKKNAGKHSMTLSLIFRRATRARSICAVSPPAAESRVSAVTAKAPSSSASALRRAGSRATSASRLPSFLRRLARDEPMPPEAPKIRIAEVWSMSLMRVLR